MDSTDDENHEALFTTPEDVKEALEANLDVIEGNGSCAAHGVLYEGNPGLEIENLGIFGLPLAHSEISRIIESSRQAPFGKGSETIVDTSVRRTWEIDASQINVRHPRWQAQHDAILHDVCSQLGVPEGSANVHAELYKLLVYEEGAMFKPHKDTEKAPGMFGTMVSESDG